MSGHSKFANIKHKKEKNHLARHAFNTMLKNEHGRANYAAMTDLMLCNEIDNTILPGYGISSVYQLTIEQRENMVGYLRRRYSVPIPQAKRCLAIV